MQGAAKSRAFGIATFLMTMGRGAAAAPLNGASAREAEQVKQYLWPRSLGHGAPHFVEHET